MDPFILFILVYGGSILLIFGIINILIFVRRKRLLRAHQEEWDKLYSELLESGASGNEIELARLGYKAYLLAMRDYFCGACFPRYKRDLDKERENHTKQRGDKV